MRGKVAYRRPSDLKLSTPPRAVHDIVVDGDLEPRGGFGDFARHFDIGTAGRRVAARMVVRQDDGRGAKFQCALDDLARIDGRVIDRAPALHLVGDQRVLAVEEQQAEFFMGQRLIAAVK
jgi:hypothetical protein